MHNGWGNFGSHYAGGKASTGSSESWKAANIYDLAGNVWEMTMEAAKINYSDPIANRIVRGGSYLYYAYVGLTLRFKRK